MGPELAEEWNVGASVGGQMSIGIPDSAQGHNANNADRAPAPGNSRSRDASMHHATKTAGAPSIDQVFRQQRSTSEGTVQVVVHKPSTSHHRQPLPNRAALPASSAAPPAPAVQLNPALPQASMAAVHSGACEPADSTTAVSKAANAAPSSLPASATAAPAAAGATARHQQHEHHQEKEQEARVDDLNPDDINDDDANDNDNRRHQHDNDNNDDDDDDDDDDNDNQDDSRRTRQRRQSIANNDPSKQPAVSFASAAAGEPDGPRNAGTTHAAAASLTSHHEGRSRGHQRLERAEDEVAAPPPLPPAPTPTPVVSAATPVGQGARIPGGGVLVPTGMTPQQLQTMMAAWSRAKSAAPRRGDSSNSGNCRVLVGIKRKASIPGGGRPPMAPPAQVPRVAATPAGASQAVNGPAGGTPTHQQQQVQQQQAQQQHSQQNQQQQQQQPCASSLGPVAQARNNDDGDALAVEDAVSMVDHGLEADIDVDMACDAVSKASGEATAAASAAEGEAEAEGDEVDGAALVGVGSVGLDTVLPSGSAVAAQVISRTSADADRN